MKNATTTTPALNSAATVARLYETAETPTPAFDRADFDRTIARLLGENPDLFV